MVAVQDGETHPYLRDDPFAIIKELKVKVGPIGASFGGTVTITGQTPPGPVTVLEYV